MKNISHPNIVEMIESYKSDENCLNIILEFCNGGDLQNKIDKMKKKVFKEQKVADYFF